jgi:hypothetical protein
MSVRLLHVALLPCLIVATLVRLASAQGPDGGSSPDSARRSFTDAIACSACHTTTAWRASDAPGPETKFDHATTGFPLTGEHVHTSCVACHNAAHPIKRECVSCHDDFHRGRLSQACDTCHTPAGWRVTRPLEIHRMTRFPLTGMHVLADCSECHVRASEQRWTDAPVDCFSCHEKDYRRSDLRPVHVGTTTTPAFPRDCSLCHRAVAWAPAMASGMAASGLSVLSQTLRALPPGHDMRFPITFGVHRTATCGDCHTSLAVPRAVRCVGCHAHNPVLLAQQHRQVVASEGACLTCHPGGARR